MTDIKLILTSQNVSLLYKCFFTSRDIVCLLNDPAHINLGKASSRDFYKLPNAKTHKEPQTGSESVLPLICQ